MRVENTLFSTKLVKWYVDRGIVVARVRQLIEFCSVVIFKDFVDLVSRKRREQSGDVKTKILADMYKLLQNSAYGVTLTQKSRYLKIQIVENSIDASAKANEDTFRALHPLGGGYYEVESTPRKINHNLPTIIGLQILQLAKIRLLELKYSFLDQYMTPGSYNVVLCDTDSLYISINRNSIDEIVDPSNKDHYIKTYKRRCGAPPDPDTILVRTYCETCEFTDGKVPGIF